MTNITIGEYLAQKGIKFRVAGKEIVTACLFGDCDKDSPTGDWHLYFDNETGQYDCKKCGAKGNLITLQKFFGDYVPARTQSPHRRLFGAELVDECQQALRPNVRQYLNLRGIADATIDAYKLGYGKFYGSWWITIPIKDSFGNFSFFKLRQDPAYGNDKITYPKGVEAQPYDWETIEKGGETILICEGELDRLIAVSKGITAITSTHGAGTFKEEWAKKVIGKYQNIYVCFDNDEAGRNGAQRVAKMLSDFGCQNISIITLPQEVGEKGDLTDYFAKLNGVTDDLFEKYAHPYPEKIDVSQFAPLTADQLAETLGLTIKEDKQNKLATFLCQLSAYSENAQFNISYNAPSSTGKSYIPTEIAKLFPKEDVMEIAYCSPTAFFHDVGEFDKEHKGYLVDLSHKILIFLDQPHNELLARLRPLLSHDKKEITLKITDKSQKFGLKTKTILLRGYPAVIFCTAGLRIDEQEATRFLLLSPEVNQNKIQQGIDATIRKEADNDKYTSWLDEDPNRGLLKERIRAIKLEGIKEIKIANQERIKNKFFGDNKMLKPRHQRDIRRLLALIKSFALLNLFWRERQDTTIIANDNDIDEGFNLWDKISLCQELNLPPYIYNLYQEIILPLWKEKNPNDEEIEALGNYAGIIGITRQDMLSRHYEVYGRPLDNCQLRQQILPMLETAGLITQEQDRNDKRKVIIFPASVRQLLNNKNGEGEGGVNHN
ncbi:MAG TPA: toprim domain-containing protein [Candidatus Paceibacterota bacterium]|nr:toprim domain-containing protein [Candidatus Pacearchaeota archaeon]HRZ51320.1 toprim domain-containing protein [Candidatus Paceibacterota bacterium]HSA37042.1 toprim domain-containing protein [Candidatus Paceibacterota bacterium]